MQTKTPRSNASNRNQTDPSLLSHTSLPARSHMQQQFLPSNPTRPVCCGLVRTCTSAGLPQDVYPVRACLRPRLPLLLDYLSQAHTRTRDMDTDTGAIHPQPPTFLLPRLFLHSQTRLSDRNPPAHPLPFTKMLFRVLKRSLLSGLHHPRHRLWKPRRCISRHFPLPGRMKASGSSPSHPRKRKVPSHHYLSHYRPRLLLRNPEDV